jgi:hypothetical protein
MALILVATAACSSSNDQHAVDDALPTVDGDVCSLPLRSDVPTGCEAGGLVGIAGTWTLTGTTMDDPYGTNMWTTSSITREVRIRREGSGYCVFGFAYAQGARVPDTHTTLCRSADGMIHYSTSTSGFAMQHMYHTRTEGVLTR